MGLPRWLSGKESACNAGATGDLGLIPRWGRFPGGGNGNPLQYSCLENPRDGGAWWPAVCGVAQSRTRLKELSSSSMHHSGVSLVAQRYRTHLPTQETLQSLGWEDPLEKEMATHPNILAWEIPWTEAPGGLQYMGSLKN